MERELRKMLEKVIVNNIKKIRFLQNTKHWYQKKRGTDRSGKRTGNLKEMEQSKGENVDVSQRQEQGDVVAPQVLDVAQLMQQITALVANQTAQLTDKISEANEILRNKISETNETIAREIN
ncbi:hypothetical protein NQ314_006091 [Rhamnusium bicolor]|uniref:Uncharacterized protein n=1 Tax=Rhamnusium bicolor TaxID=1586634 RepID=A0AAV8Z869_9CUCU|nr:hypothetical protein NQ314_006091 [Rhamnusium bicolor]